MQLIVDCEVTPGGNFMKRSACACISMSPTLLGCFIVMILYRKISEKSRPTKKCNRGERLLFAKFAEDPRVTPGVLTLLNH